MNNVGLFIVSYEITTGAIGAPVLHTDLVVSTPSRGVTGHGNIQNASVNPPFELNSRLAGEFTYMTVMPNSTHILVTLEGSALTPPVQPILVQNMRIRMVLEADWSAGTATYEYVDAHGNWHTITNAKVKKVNSNTKAPDASVASDALLAN